MQECILKGVLPKRRHIPRVTKQIRSAIRKRNLLYRNHGFLVAPVCLASIQYCQKQSCNNDEKGEAILPAGPRECKCQALLEGSKISHGLILLNNSHTELYLEKTADTDTSETNMLSEHFYRNFNHSVPPLNLSEDSQLTLDENDCPTDLLCTKDEILQLLQNLGCH